MLDPGMHQYSGHHPLGEYGVAPGSVEITAGQITRLACFRGQCQEVQATAQQQPGQT